MRRIGSPAPWLNLSALANVKDVALTLVIDAISLFAALPIVTESPAPKPSLFVTGRVVDVAGPPGAATFVSSDGGATAATGMTVQ